VREAVKNMSTEDFRETEFMGAIPDIAHRKLPMFLTVGETAELLRTTRKGIYAMVERGQLPGVARVGKRVLIRSDVLLQWLRQKSAPSPER
jgi:excisionase family DNA binding protein